MSSTYTPPPPPPESDDGPRVTRTEVRDLSRLRRTTDQDSKIAGVAGGLARHLDIDPIIMRVLLVVLIFFGGAGLIVYLSVWVLVPEDGSDSQPLGLDPGARSVALVIAGAVAALAAFAEWIGARGGFPNFVIIAGLAALLIITLVQRRREQPPAYYTGPTGYGAQAAPPYGPMPFQAPANQAPPFVAAPPYEPAPADEPVPFQTATAYEPPPVRYAAPPRRVDPRKRGPLLFLPTLALIALACGVLGMIDVTGTHVVAAAYPAVALGTTALMLLLGAFWGRAGGLIALGLLLVPGLVATSAVDYWDTTTQSVSPGFASQVRSEYTMDAGEIVVDLRDVRDLDELDGRTLDLHGDFGRIEVLLPPGLNATVRGDLELAGDLRLLDEQRDGFDIALGAATSPWRPGSPQITIDASLVAGEIRVLQGVQR